MIENIFMHYYRIPYANFTRILNLRYFVRIFYFIIKKEIKSHKETERNPKKVLLKSYRILYYKNFQPRILRSSTQKWSLESMLFLIEKLSHLLKNTISSLSCSKSIGRFFVQINLIFMGFFFFFCCCVEKKFTQ